MCVPKFGRWTESLRHILGKVYEPTTRTPVPWLLSGEAALALQGVDADPQIVEFRAVSPFAVAYFSGFMKAYEAPANAATVIYKRGGNVAPADSWRSNVHQRIVAWGWESEGACWLGRWNLDGCTVQVSSVRGAEPDPVSLAHEDFRRVYFEGMNVAVVPLEFLLADSAMRSQPQETNRILHTMRAAGYNSATLHKALNELPADRASRILRLLEMRLIAG